MARQVHNYIGLCVEHRLGHPDAHRLIKIVLETLASLYKFDRGDNPFRGYVIRWDPATSDDWSVETDSKGYEVPQVCCQFLVNADKTTWYERHYLYCTPLDDPRYLKSAKEAAGGGKDRFRRWEPSMDEYVGLMAGYFMVFHTFKDDTGAEAQAIVTEVKRQLGLVGKYLQHVGYLLVRPCGGFAARGSAGPNPCLEYPFSRVFSRVTDDPFAVSATFKDAIQLANLTQCWKHRRMDRDPVTIVSQSPAWSLLQGLLGNDPVGTLTSAFTGFDLDNVQLQVNEALHEAAQTILNLNCLDLVHDDDRYSFVVASVAKKICLANPQAGFELWMNKPLNRGAWSDYFKPLVGLTALDDDDTVVRNAYLKWYDDYVAPHETGPDEDEVLRTDSWGMPAIATAVATLLRKDEPQRRSGYESRLTKEIEKMRHTLENTCKGELVLYDIRGDGLPGRPGLDDIVVETHDKRGNWMGYMAALTLAWLHQIRLGANVLSDMPTPQQSSVQSWPPPEVPKEVIRLAHTGFMQIPLGALQLNFHPPMDSDNVELFLAPPPKSQDNEIGKTPPPRDAESHDLNYTYTPFLSSDYKEFRLPCPDLELNLGERRDEFTCVLASKTILEMRNVAELNDGFSSNNEYLITIKFDTFPRTWPPSFGGAFRAKYALSWVKQT